MKDWPLEAERELLANACYPGRHPHALWNFVRFACGWHSRCSQPGQSYWLTKSLHLPMLDWVDAKIAEWKSNRLAGIKKRLHIAIIVPREHGKTNTLTKTIPAYTLLAEPDISWYIGSSTMSKSRDFLRGIKPVLDGTDPFALFTWFYGNWYSPDRIWTQEEIVTAARTSLGVSEPSIGTFSVERGITSKHPLGVFYDDPIEEEKLTEGGNWNQLALRSLDSLYPALRADSLFFLVGTRYLDDDPLGTSLSTEGVAEWVGHHPIETYDPGIWHVYFLQARDLTDTLEFPKGRPILPENGHTDESLSRYEKRRPKHYACQMMNDPAAGEHAELTREQIETMKIDRADLPPIEYATIHVDTAFKDSARKSRADNTAIVTWLHDLRPTGIVYLDSVLCSREWRAEDFDTHLLQVLFDLKRRNIRVRAITDEKEVSGKMGVYRQHLETVISTAGLRIPEIIQYSRTHRNKTVRIRTAANYWVDGYVRLLRDARGIDILVTEMLRIGVSKHDDASDAAADVFNPDVWRRPQATYDDGQPVLPTQPGDDILKGQQAWIDSMKELQDALRHPPRDDEESDYQPYERLLAASHPPLDRTRFG